MFVLFKHENTGTLAHHKAVAARVKGARGMLGIVVAARQRMHDVKAGNTVRADRAFAAARDHHVCVAAADDPGGFTDRVQAGSTGRHRCEVRALEVS